MIAKQTYTNFLISLTQLDRKRCLVVGGGAVAERKLCALVESGAHPVVISPTATPTIQALQQAGQLDWQQRAYRPSDLEGTFLLIVATNDAGLNRQIAKDAQELPCLVNLVDDPEGSSFHTTATVRRGDLVLAVSTTGSSPRLAAYLRNDLAQRYGAEYGELTQLLAWLRREAAQRLTPQQRARLWEDLAFEQLLAWLADGQHEQALAFLEQQIIELEQAL